MLSSSSEFPFTFVSWYVLSHLPFPTYRKYEFITFMQNLCCNTPVIIVYITNIMSPLSECLQIVPFIALIQFWCLVRQSLCPQETRNLNFRVKCYVLFQQGDGWCLSYKRSLIKLVKKSILYTVTDILLKCKTQISNHLILLYTLFVCFLKYILTHRHGFTERV